MKRLLFPLLSLVLLAASITGPCAAAQPQPAAPAPPALTAEQAQDLLKTLDDPAARQKFTDQLRAFVQARQAVAPPPDPVGERVASRFLESLSDTVAKFGESIFSTAAFVADAPHFVAWLQQQWQSKDTRNRLIAAFGVIALVLVSAWVFEWLAELLLAPTRRRLEGRQQAPGWSRVPSLALYLVVESVPIAAFLLVALALLAFVRAEPVPRLVTLAVINANIFAGALGLMSAGLLAPRNPGLRLIPITDETAAYLHVWVRRIGYLAIYGYFAIAASAYVGLVAVGREVLMKLLGVFVALLAVILILQNRTVVASNLTTTGNSRAMGVLRHLVPYWHVLAIVYVLLALGVFMVEADGFAYVARASGFMFLIVCVAAILAVALRAIVGRLFRIGDDVAKQFPSLEAKANRYLHLVSIVGTVTIWTLAVLAVLQAWGLDSLRWLASPLGTRVGSSLVSIAITVVVALAIWETVNALLERHIAQVEAEPNGYRRAARLRTIMPLIRRVMIIALVVMCGMVILSEIGVNVGPLIAAGGAVGIAVGFGAQAFVKDFINSAQIILEDSIAVGDVVQIGDKSGVVEAITMRRVSLRSADGTLHIIPFGDIQTISNKSKDFAYAVFDVVISYGQDVDKVAEVLSDVGAALRKEADQGAFMLSDLEVLGVEDFTDKGVVLKARIKTWPGKQWAVAHAFRRRMMQAFDEFGIRMPFMPAVAAAAIQAPAPATVSSRASGVAASTTSRATS
jgi:small-conductance mechanosensitive channel